MHSKKKLITLVAIGIMCVVVLFLIGIRAITIFQPKVAGERTANDLPDDFIGHQIHVMYVLPSDGVDENLATNGTLARSVSTFQRWLVGQTSGQQLRLDTYRGALDISFFRLSRTDSEIASYGAFVRDQIESELVSAGFDHPNKIYAVYYGGGSTFSCGGGAWPPELPGEVAALYLRGTPPEARPCATNSFASSEDRPGYLEFSMLHEILHTIGIVASCAPHHTLRGHVSDSPNDLMYAGSLQWQPSILDTGRDDYFRHNDASCLDLANSPYMTSNSAPIGGSVTTGCQRFATPAAAAQALRNRLGQADIIERSSNPGANGHPVGETILTKNPVLRLTTWGESLCVTERRP